MHCGGGVKAGWLIPFENKVSVAGKTVQSLINTCRSEHFTGVYRTHYEALYCSVCFTLLLQCSLNERATTIEFIPTLATDTVAPASHFGFCLTGLLLPVCTYVLHHF